MKKLLYALILFVVTLACVKVEESPLVLPPAAEPSANQHNNFGIEDFNAGRYEDAFLHFKQAFAADRTAGEIYFNLGLALHAIGKDHRVPEQFQLARKYAQGNPEILESKLLLSYLQNPK